MPPASGLAHRLRTLEREHVRDMWRKLDASIPTKFKQKPHRNAGARALGAEGRAAADILNDCIAYVKEIRSAAGSAAHQGPTDGGGGHRRSAACDRPSNSRGESISPATRTEGLLSAHGLFCVEVEMKEPLHHLVNRRWMIRRVGKGTGIYSREGSEGGSEGQRQPCNYSGRHPVCVCV